MSKIGVLIVGYGFMGKTHALVYEEMGSVEIVGIVDAFLKGDEFTLTSGKKIPIFTDLDQGLAETDPTFVDLCLPTDLHVTMGLKVFQAGKPLFCEKPVALDLAGAMQLEEGRKKAGVEAMVGHCIRFWPEYQKLAQVIREGLWGKVRSISFRRYAGRPASAVQNWVSDPERCKGAALDLHIHDTDFITSVLGRPQEVTSKGVHEGSGWNWIATDYRYDGMVIRAEGGWNLPSSWPFEMSYRAVFEGGVMDYSSAQSPSLRFYPESGFPAVVFQAEVESAAGEGRSNLAGFSGYVATLRYFVERIKKKEPIEESTLLQAAESLRVTLAEIRSAQEGKSVGF